jgi:hypothetical protein
MNTDTPVPDPSSFTSAPMRNQMRVQLNAPVSEIWALVGDIGRLPDYSGGLERVEVKKTSSGAPEEYTCHFKPTEPGGPGAVARDIVRWYEPNRGWASTDAEPNDFGTKNSLHIVTVSLANGGTLLDWRAHYDAPDLETNRTELNKALGDIAQRLIARFGGRVLEISR